MTFQILDNFLKEDDFKFIKDNTMCYNFPLHYANEVNENDNHNFYFEHTNNFCSGTFTLLYS